MSKKPDPHPAKAELREMTVNGTHSAAGPGSTDSMAWDAGRSSPFISTVCARSCNGGGASTCRRSIIGTAACRRIVQRRLGPLAIHVGGRRRRGGRAHRIFFSLRPGRRLKPLLSVPRHRRFRLTLLSIAGYFILKGEQTHE